MAAQKSPPGEVFRDPIHGAEAKRDELLRKRRIQVSTQPLFVRALYVRRYARAVTGLGLFVAGMLLLSAGINRGIYHWLAGLLPGNAPAPLATLFTGILATGFTLYFVARSWAERRYSRAMKVAITETHDVYGDVDRLSGEHPDQVGRKMAEKLSVSSRSLPMLASLALVPLIYVWLKQSLFESWPTANWIDAEFAAAAPSLLPLVITFSIFVLLLCRGFRAGRRPWRFWRPAAYAGAVMVPLLSSTVCYCADASKAVGLAGMTLVFAIATSWAYRSDAGAVDSHELGERE